MQALASLSGSQWSLHSCACLAPPRPSAAPIANRCLNLGPSPSSEGVRGVPGVPGDDGERAFGVPTPTLEASSAPRSVPLVAPTSSSRDVPAASVAAAVTILSSLALRSATVFAVWTDR